MIWPLARKDGSRDLDNPLAPVTGPYAGKAKMFRQLRPVPPGTHPSKYWRDSMLLNFSACTRTAMFSMIWPLARKEGSRDLDNPLAPVTGPYAGKDKMFRQLRAVPPGTHPSKYWLGSMLLNFSACTRTGTFSMIWPLARNNGSRDLDNPLAPVTGPYAGKAKMFRQLRPVPPGTHPSKYW
jgi:hypothetical protein